MQANVEAAFCFAASDCRGHTSFECGHFIRRRLRFLNTICGRSPRPGAVGLLGGVHSGWFVFVKPMHLVEAERCQCDRSSRLWTDLPC